MRSLILALALAAGAQAQQVAMPQHERYSVVVFEEAGGPVYQSFLTNSDLAEFVDNTAILTRIDPRDAHYKHTFQGSVPVTPSVRLQIGLYEALTLSGDNLPSDPSKLATELLRASQRQCPNGQCFPRRNDPQPQPAPPAQPPQVVTVEKEVPGPVQIKEVPVPVYWPGIVITLIGGVGLLLAAGIAWASNALSSSAQGE